VRKSAGKEGYKSVSGTKILLVQEIGTLTGELLNKLRAAGLIVTGVAETGAEALRLSGANPPQVVLLDTYLKGNMSPSETADALAAQNPSLLAVIYLTYRESDVPGKPQHYVLKPFSINELVRKIEQVINT
jgi:DNA-binding response OmpR family regulator